MREIEIKARVRDEAKLLTALKKLEITLGKPTKQHDVVYNRPGAIDRDPKENWLRLRTENDSKVIFTLKRSVTGELDSIEHETTVGNEAEMAVIIGYLGYELFSDITKIRRETKYGNIEICYDELPKLGKFIEVEKLCPEDADIDAVREELWELFNKLGIDKSDEVTNGYDVLMHKLESSEKNEAKAVTRNL